MQHGIVFFLCGALLIVLTFHGNNFANAMKKMMRPPEAKLYPGFSRHCADGDNGCKFISNDNEENALHFKCRENKICFCARGETPGNSLVWPINWNGGNCTVGKGGPCGENDGLTVNCDSDHLNCIQGRCRDPAELNMGMVNHFCHDDIDCHDGLSCKPPKKDMHIRIKRCF